MDRGDPSSERRSGASPIRSLVLPVAVLVVVVAIVSGLVLSGLVQGHQTRVGPAHAPTTQPTVLIVPQPRRAFRG